MTFLRNKHSEVDPLWHVQIILFGLIVFQLFTPINNAWLPQYTLPALELLAMLALQVVTPKKVMFDSVARRAVVVALIALIAIGNASSLQHLVQVLFDGGHIQASSLLVSAVSIYLTNVVVFALLFWEIDGGGPGSRRSNSDDANDFLFPQQPTNKKWQPTFIDYLYIAITNATAFSPTDTMPLSRRAKMLMAVQATLSLMLVAIIAARAVNTL
jgi:uncharacterized membrane protein